MVTKANRKIITMNKVLIETLTEYTKKDTWHIISRKDTYDDVNASLNSFAKLGLAIRFNEYNRSLMIFEAKKYKDYIEPIFTIIKDVQAKKAKKIISMGCFFTDILKETKIKKETILFTIAILLTNAQIVEHNTIGGNKIYYINV